MNTDMQGLLGMLFVGLGVATLLCAPLFGVMALRLRTLAQSQDTKTPPPGRIPEEHDKMLAKVMALHRLVTGVLLIAIPVMLICGVGLLRAGLSMLPEVQQQP